MTSAADTGQVGDLLATYAHALETSDAELAASCYTNDGVSMPAGSPTAIGDTVRDAYARIFDTIRLDVTFTIDEVQAFTDPGIAYALTRSNGHKTVLETGTETAEANREVFILRRDDDHWKIARYMFNQAE